MKNQLYDILGDSIVFDNSNERWAERRKHLSSIFYKDKMVKILDIVIKKTLERTEFWKISMQ